MLLSIWGEAAFPQLVQPHSTQLQPRPHSHSFPPPLCNDINEGKNREERKTQEQLESAPLSGSCKPEYITRLLGSDT